MTGTQRILFCVSVFRSRCMSCFFFFQEYETKSNRYDKDTAYAYMYIRITSPEEQPNSLTVNVMQFWGPI